MEKEYLPEESKFEQGDAKGQKNTADDLKFMRSVVEKSYRQVKPETHVTIMWGLICMAAYISIHFLAKHNLQKWITPLYLSLIGFGVFYSLIAAFLFLKRQKKSGFVPQLFSQIAWIWLIVALPIILWDRLGLFKNIFCEAGFMYAMGLSIALSLTGIFHSKEWFLGGIIIFAGMLLAFFTKDYSYPCIILGLSTGAGLIIPAIIVDRNYRKWEKSHE